MRIERNCRQANYFAWERASSVEWYPKNHMMVRIPDPQHYWVVRRWLKDYPAKGRWRELADHHIGFECEEDIVMLVMVMG